MAFHDRKQKTLVGRPQGWMEWRDISSCVQRPVTSHTVDHSERRVGFPQRVFLELPTPPLHSFSVCNKQMSVWHRLCWRVLSLSSQRAMMSHSGVFWGNLTSEWGSFHCSRGGAIVTRVLLHSFAPGKVVCFSSSATNKCGNMKLPELEDSISRFRFAESCLGMAGCLCVCYAVWTPFWLADRGLWAEWNNTEHQQAGDHIGSIVFNALEAERVFGVLSCLMALSSGALCLVFALCWTSETVRSYSNTRSLLMAGQALYPTTLLLLTLVCTGFFFLLSWSLFTYQHRDQIRLDLSSLGSSYWLGALGWALLLVVEPIVFLVEQCIVPDILPDLERAVESWRATSQLKSMHRPFSEGYFPANKDKSSVAPRGYMSSL
ncbi:uncharacterized protein LOC115360939 [Myripristis murdjan]|uniref:uncharacterized protein LOC115360939 n=1 Tax=Myripristis murdjan TaxID=586833 RepID=UPI001175FD12|nr:uncharacterized protein LOC115360939 [Myripristis murdjan]